MKKRYQTIVSIGIIILITIGLQLSGVLYPLENFIVGLFYHSAQFSYDKELGVNKENLINEKLTQPFDPEIVEAVCSIDTAETLLLREENTELRSQLDYFSKNKFSHIGAEVIGRTVDPLSTIITINRGLKDGVFPTNPVIVGGGVLVGTIIQSFDTISYVRLLNDNQSKIGSTLLNGDRTIGLVEGGYDIGVQMNFIPQNEKVNPGDIVVTSGLTENMPRGLLIGKVEFIEKQQLEPFQQAILDPIADLSYLHLVSVIITTSTHATP